MTNKLSENQRDALEKIIHFLAEIIQTRLDKLSHAIDELTVTLEKSKSQQQSENRISIQENRASDIRALGNAVVIGLVVEQAFHQTFELRKAVAGVLFLAITWIIGAFIERGGVE